MYDNLYILGFNNYGCFEDSFKYDIEITKNNIIII